MLIWGQRQGLATWSFLCSKVLLKYNRDRETSDIDIRRGQRERPLSSLQHAVLSVRKLLTR